MKKILYVFLLSIVFVMGCTGGGNSDLVKKDENKGNTADSGGPQLSGEIISDILQSIPAPLEISLLIKEIGSEYNVSNLSSPSYVSNYNTSFKQSLNLGVYGTDLGFANLYNKNQDVLDFLNSVKKLADDLNIGQFFDYNTIKRLAQTSNNIDSLLQLTQQNFEQINLHLQEQKRENLSILILTGGWVEALYLSTLVYEKSKNPKLKEKIGEQKVALEQILLVLDIYKTKPNFSPLIEDLKELAKIYARVKIVVSPGQSVMVEKDGELVIEQGSQTTVEIDDKDLESITSLLKSIRNKIVK